MDSDDNFMIYRRFGFLYSRVLLQKQDELRAMEETLDEMDQRDSRESDKSRLALQSRVKDQKRTGTPGHQTRQELLRSTEEKLYDYGRLLLQAQQIVSMNRPAARDRTSIQNFMENGFEENGSRVRPLLQADSKFVYCKEDLVTLRPGRESAWLDSSVERLLGLLHCKLVRYIFCSKETRGKTDAKDIHYYTRERVDRLVTLIICSNIILLLVVPVYALYRLSNTIQVSGNTSNVSSIGVLLVASLVFSVVLFLFTKAKRHEILGASAAYCAVLVVFIGNVGNNLGYRGQL
ncbi:hypothetical protein MMC22_005770 [Lobaria immixta]|nr:hypothetical protein [Lobaria immixta]